MKTKSTPGLFSGISAGLLAATFLAVSPVMAGDDNHDTFSGHHGPGGHGGPGRIQGMRDPERMVRHISRWLDLDDTQTQELSNIALAAKPQLDALREKTRANHDALSALDVDDSAYTSTVQNLAIENGQIATEITMLVAGLRADIYSKLTAEQREKLAEGVGKMRQRWDERRRARGYGAET